MKLHIHNWVIETLTELTKQESYKLTLDTEVIITNYLNAKVIVRFRDLIVTYSYKYNGGEQPIKRKQINF